MLYLFHLILAEKSHSSRFNRTCSNRTRCTTIPDYSLDLPELNTSNADRNLKMVSHVFPNCVETERNISIVCCAVR
jgi:hypothetical protein